MPAQKPERPSPGHAMLLPRVSQDDDTQRAFQAVAPAIQQLRAGLDAAQSAADSSASGRLLAVRKLTGSGTYVPTPGTTFAIVDMCGGGGGGGGAGGGANVAAGAGGGSGVRIRFQVGTPGGPELTGGAYAGGAGGAGGTNAGGNGANGGTTTALLNGATYTATGGGGGQGLASTAGTAEAIITDPVAGSTAPPTSLYRAAGLGSPGLVLAGAAAFPGDGGSNGLGIAGRGAHATLAAGGDAVDFGAGGGGANAAAAGFTGGAGGPGVIIIEEHS